MDIFKYVGDICISWLFILTANHESHRRMIDSSILTAYCCYSAMRHAKSVYFCEHRRFHCTYSELAASCDSPASCAKQNWGCVKGLAVCKVAEVRMRQTKHRRGGCVIELCPRQEDKCVMWGSCVKVIRTTTVIDYVSAMYTPVSLAARTCRDSSPKDNWPK